MAIKETCPCGAELSITDNSSYAVAHIYGLQKAFLQAHVNHGKES